MTRIFIILGVYYLIGGIAIAVINRRQRDADANARWIKLLVYVIITLVLTSALLFAPWIAIGLSLPIVITGFYELLRLERVRWRSRMLTLIGYSILATLFCLFVWRSRQDQLPALIYLMVLSFDGFSQISGQLFRGSRIAPSISPGKTWSGLAGGMVMGVFTASVATGKLWMSGLWKLSVAVCLLAFAGDMIASSVKRMAGVKDYSSLIPGHGGVLDRFDSFVFAGAIVECYFRLT
jgi:phosphatidate cytidylyltransferase